MSPGRRGRLIEGGEGDHYLTGTRRHDVIFGQGGDDAIVGGQGIDLLYGGEGSDVFVFDDQDTGDVSFGRADTIGDFSAKDFLDLTETEVLFFAGFGVAEPVRGGSGILQGKGNVYVTWNTFGEFHDVELTRFDGSISSLLQQIRWYEDDYAGSVATDASIEPGETVTGAIEVDTDQDWFRIELEQGLLYTFDLQGEADGGGTLPDPYLVLYDESGNFVADGYYELIFLAGVPGTYLISAQSFGGTGSYALAVAAEPYVDDFGGDTSTNGEIAAGETRTGEVGHPGDQDWFRIELEQGLLYTFDLQGGADGGGTLPDPYLVLYDESGNFVADGYEDLTFVADVPGTYFVSAQSFGGMGSYALAVAAELHVDDFAAHELTDAATGTYKLSAALTEDALLA